MTVNAEVVAKHGYNIQPNRSQSERLIKLIQECSEVQKEATKILEHGAVGFDPVTKAVYDNTKALEEELGQVLAVVGLMAAERDLNMANVAQSFADKLPELADRMRYQNPQTILALSLTNGSTPAIAQ